MTGTPADSVTLSIRPILRCDLVASAIRPTREPSRQRLRPAQRPAQHL